MSSGASSSGPRRVVISGMGWVTPLGTGIGEVWSRLLAGDCAIGPITRFDASTFATNFAAEVRGFDLRSKLGDRLGRHAEGGLHTHYAISAALDAWESAGFTERTRPDPSRFGMYLGAGEGPIEPFSAFGAAIAGWREDGRTVDANAWWEYADREMLHRGELEQEPNAPLAHLADLFGARGPSFNCMTACAASTQSVGEAWEIIRRGDADVMLAGGSHSMIHPMGMSGFIRLTAMSTRRDDPTTASRPFDRSRDGFVMGEGAGIVVLESLEHALARGAEPLAEVVGFGSTADAYRITDIHPEGAGGARAMAHAVRQAGLDPAKLGDDGRPCVHYISAHGTGTPENDGTETAAVKRVFGDLAPKIPFSSVKSMIGHLIQAAGAVELMTCVQAIRTGWIPPTINLRSPDTACDLDYVPNSARDLTDQGGVEVAISNGFGFGGQNDCVCVRRFAG